jgi:hypothetical protein
LSHSLRSRNAASRDRNPRQFSTALSRIICLDTLSESAMSVMVAFSSSKATLSSLRR